MNVAEKAALAEPFLAPPSLHPSPHQLQSTQLRVTISMSEGGCEEHTQELEFVAAKHIVLSVRC